MADTANSMAAAWHLLISAPMGLDGTGGPAGPLASLLPLPFLPMPLEPCDQSTEP